MPIKDRFQREVRLLLCVAALLCANPVFAAEPDAVTAKAEAGDVASQCELGIAYLEGRWGINYQKAFHWLRQAAEQGCTEVQYRLADMYQRGRGVAADDAEACYWYAQAAEGGHKKAQYYRALMHKYGTGTPINDEQALYWYEQSARQGFVNAQAELASMHYLGRGTPVNFTEAYVWSTVELACGSAYSESLRSRVVEKLSAEELRVAESRATTLHGEMKDCGP